MENSKEESSLEFLRSPNALQVSSTYGATTLQPKVAEAYGDSSTLDINTLFENALNDPTLLSTLDINKLLDSLENDKNDYLENKTIETVTKEIYSKIDELDISIDNKKHYCQLLGEYRLVNDIHELHKGKQIKWIRLSNKRLIGGGIVVNIKFLDNGTHVLVKNPISKFIQIKFDDVCIFQKMTMQEQLILMAYGYVTVR